MFNTVDLYLGAFLLLCGFALSLLNLRRVMKKNSFSAVLLSENILLMCIGLAFIVRTVYELNPVNMNMNDIEARISEIPLRDQGSKSCSFSSILMSYGPLVVSLVNSFLTLIIDNYMHYKILQDAKKKEDENIVQDIGQNSVTERKIEVRLFSFLTKYFSYIAILLQWIVPVFLGLSMYPMGVIEEKISMSELARQHNSCTTIVEISNETCYNSTYNTNYTLELREYIQPPIKYIETYEYDYFKNNMSNLTENVINNVYEIISNLKNQSSYTVNMTSPILVRKSRSNDKCMKICYVNTKNLLLYMFVISVFSYFVPITISTVILTKIHVMNVKKGNIKTYVSRELLYNILFWTPVMFDTFLSLILCSYTMNGTRTTLFNVVANIYQAVKNFMNTKYFKDNAIVPV